MKPFSDMPLDAMIAFQHFIIETMQQLEKITIPIAIFYGKRDEDLYAYSADTIYQRVHSARKHKRGFENSKHLMTLGREQDKILQEIMSFFIVKSLLVGRLTTNSKLCYHYLELEIN
ncbi:hypothetical protein OL548_19095 [Lysinibacillus sp. MHQ-1]|nr:hypothetical protein OL548_19095 [Lysinibacillus sp. MHQ-1]